MKRVSLALCVAIFGATAASADVINRRNQCERWEYVPANEALGSKQAALLFCSEEDRVWLSLRIECQVEEKRMSVIYRPGFPFNMPEVVAEAAITPADPAAPSIEPTDEQVFAMIPLENEVAQTEVTFPTSSREMVFFDFRSFGYTSVAYQQKNSNWQFFEPEPLSPVFSRLITGNYADISLLATGETERLPLRGSGKALRPIVETCRKAKRNG